MHKTLTFCNSEKHGIEYSTGVFDLSELHLHYGSVTVLLILRQHASIPHAKCVRKVSINWIILHK